MGEFIGGSFVIQLVNFAVVLFLLNILFFKPYLKYVREQEAKQEELDNAHRVISESRAAAAHEAKAELEAARAKAKALVADAQSRAAKEAAAAVEAGQAEGRRAAEAGLAQVEGERAALERELKAKAVDLAVRLNAKLLGSSTEANEQFIRKNA